MKKLIALLGAVTLVASSSVVVACGTSKVERFDTPSITEALYEKLIAGLKSNGDFQLTEGQDFDKIDFENTLKMMINEIIANEWNDESTKTLLKNLGMTVTDKDTKFNMNDIMDSISTNEFFEEYTASIINSDTGALDIDFINNKFITLNPTNLLGTTEFFDEAEYSIWFHENDSWLRWQANGEFGEESFLQIPTVKTLSDLNGNFKILMNVDNEADFKSGTATNEAVDGLTTVFKVGEKVETPAVYGLDDSEQGNVFTGSEILKYRFQKYFKSTIQTKLFENLLGMSYLDSSLFSRGWSTSNFSERFLYVNTASDVAKSTQTWSTDPKNITSKVKMVWNFTVNGTNEDVRKAVAKLDSLIDTKGVIKPGTNLEEIWKALSAVEEGTTRDGEYTDANGSLSGIDPFLKLSGFNGFVKNSGDNTVESVQGNFTLSDATKADIYKADKPTVLTNNKKGYESTESVNKDIVIVLPVYLTDLLSNEQSQFSLTNDEVSTDTDLKGLTLNLQQNVWTSLNDKFVTDDTERLVLPTDFDTAANSKDGLEFKNIKGNIYVRSVEEATPETPVTIGDYSITFKTAVSNTFTVDGTIDDKTEELKGGEFGYDIKLLSTDDSYQNSQFIKKWNTSEKSSSDIKTMDINTKKALLNELEFITTKDSNVIEKAKENLYSEYINEDDVKYTKLYDAILKYLKDEKESTD
ncbi:lipoprotein [[Acholeplasma] multilocale]|uniref:lipoprotein n=1 Tax=[Acholeplasma] multilocale TaxID=264638 RepID=UPI00047D6CAC|nr:lipoprotein [[Acholeplasma] multilocale]